MHPEIENLINMSLADGEVTEKEKAIILRKAEVLELDKDEVEMILDGKIALMKKEKAIHETQNNIPKSNKEGDLKKCPSCGTPVQSFTTKCKDCGHEFRNTEASNLIKDFFDQFNQIETDERSKIDRTPGTGFFANDKIIIAEELARRSIANRQSMMIATFPIPNNKEDLLSFLSVSIPEGTKKRPNLMGMGPGHREYHLVQLIDAWHAKSEQIIMKARLSLKDDKSTLDEIEYYANQLKLRTNTGCLGLILGPFMKIIQGGK